MKSISMSRAPRFSACVAMMFALFSAAHIELYAEIANPVTADCTLTSDESVDGILTVNSGVTVNLAGCRLTVKGLAGDGTITGAGTLYVDTAGGSVENSTVALTGGLKLTVGGGGTFIASKASQTYTGGTEAEANTTISLGTVTHPLGNGNATQTVTLGENAQLKYNNLQNADTCCYSFILHQGSMVDAGSNGGRWVRHFKDITLQGDATFKAQSNICVGTNTGDVPCLVTLNGHTLYLNLNGDHNMRGFKTVGEGKVVFQAGYAAYYGTSTLPVDLSSATLGFEGSGYFFNGSSGLTASNLYFRSTSNKKWHSQGAAESYVLGTYIAGDWRAPFTMSSGATLDLSETSGTWNAGGLPIDGNNADRDQAGRVTFLAANATYTVDVGTRTIAKGDVLARFESGYVPTDSVVFNLAATGAAQTPEDRHLGVVAKDSGSGYYNLVVKDTLTPYARWVIDNDNPANSGWKFYNPADGTENTDWRDGVTEDVEVRIYSYDEYIAVKAANVSPSRFDICGTIEIPAGVVSLDMTRCFDTLAEGGVIDLNGNSVTIQDFSGAGMITDTSDGIPGELHLATAGGSVENSTIALTGNLRLVVEGDGTFTASKANQSYTGGTEVQSGTLLLGTATHPLGDGNATQTVTLGAGAKFTSGANYNSTTCAYNFIVDEGASMTFATTGDRDTRRFGSIELLGDASITMQGKSAFVGLSPTNPSTFKLNGNTLSVTVNSGADSNAKHIKSLDAGTIRFVSVESAGMQNQNGATDFSSARVEFASGAYVHLGNSGMTVGDFMYAGTKWRTFGGGIKVAGTYEAAAFRPPIQMLGGSTLDLSGITGALSATGTAPSNTVHKDHTEAGEITFASDATVGVDLSGRTDLRELAKSATPYVVMWSSQPNATFTLDAASYEKGYRITPDSTGLKVSYRQGLTIIVR